MKHKSEILFVNPGRYLYAYPSLGIGYLSSYLKKYSKYVEKISLADENAKEVPEDIIKENRPRIVGIIASTPQINRAHAIAEFCKAMDKDIICIVGGVHTSILPKRTLKEFPCFDVGVCGEGEETLKELVDNIFEADFRLDKVDCSSIKGLVYRKEDKVFVSPKRELIKNLDTIPIPDRRLYNLKFYLKPRQAIRGVARKAVQMMSSRGCPYNCRFCSSCIMWERKVRFHSSERFIEEVEDLISLGFNGFFLHDDTFIADKKRVHQICELLIKKNYHKKLIWAAQLRPNLINNEDDVEMLRLMKKAGCLQVEYGFESGSDKVLSFLKRNSATIKQNQKAIDLTKKSGLRIFGNFMLGTQGETKEDIIKTKKFVLRNSNKLDYFQAYITTPYPGTELWDLCKKEGLLKDVTWEKFGMGILDEVVFSNTVDHDFVLQTVRELTQHAVGKISTIDKLKWLRVRLADDPKYVFNMLKEHFFQSASIKSHDDK
ncbi:MAG: methyltransferase [uncultured bacterium]|nr:MAG: methyltransferase [uncultured bacterium]